MSISCPMIAKVHRQCPSVIEGLAITLPFRLQPPPSPPASPPPLTGVSGQEMSLESPRISLKLRPVNIRFGSASTCHPCRLHSQLFSLSNTCRISTSQTNFGADTKLRCHIRRGSSSKRYAHSKPRPQTHLGAREYVPA